MNHRVLASIGSAFATAALLFVAPTIGLAQQETTATATQGGGLEEIVVTAQRRAENAVDVPISITALSQEQLTTANVQSLGDIQRLTPALRFDYQTGFAQPTIRGIGTGITTSGGGSNVGVYIDGFYSPTRWRLTSSCSRSRASMSSRARRAPVRSQHHGRCDRRDDQGPER